MKKIEKVKIGVIGAGHLGRCHIQQLRLIPQAELIGFFDTDPNRSIEIEKEFNIPSFPNFEKLLKNVDAISIVTPTQTHFDYAKQAIEEKKHLFIEKPITATVEQGNKIVELCSTKKTKLQVGHIERFNPAILALEGFTINPLFIESHRMSNFNPRGTDVPVVLDLMIHDIDLILSFIHSPVKSIDASGVSIISENEDIANCRLNFENGAVANVTASRISTRKMRKMRFFQSNAYISVDFLEGNCEIYELTSVQNDTQREGISFTYGKIGEGTNAKEIRYRRYEKKDINPLNYELTLFLKSIIDNTEPVVGGKEAVRALKVADAILKNIAAHAQLVKEKWHDYNGH